MEVPRETSSAAQTPGKSPPLGRQFRRLLAADSREQRVMRREFRTFIHPPPAMLAVLEHHGLQHTFTHRGIPWQVAGLERR